MDRRVASILEVKHSIFQAIRILLNSIDTIIRAMCLAAADQIKP